MSWADRDKLSSEDIQNIIAEVKAGIPKITVARKYGIHHSIIYYYFKKEGIVFLRKKSAWASKKDYNREYRLRNKEKILEHERLRKKKKVKLKKGNSYSDLLAIENEKRKAKGWYQFKDKLNFGFNKANKRASHKTRPLPAPDNRLAEQSRNGQLLFQKSDLKFLFRF